MIHNSIGGCFRVTKLTENTVSYSLNVPELMDFLREIKQHVDILERQLEDVTHRLNSAGIEHA